MDVSELPEELPRWKRLDDLPTPSSGEPPVDWDAWERQQRAEEQAVADRLTAQARAAAEMEQRNLVNDVKKRKRASRMADESIVEEDAEARVAELPDFRVEDMVTRLSKPRVVKPAVFGGGDYSPVIARRGHVIRLLADFKAGKTTTGLAWLRCSLTGEPFLGMFPVVEVEASQMVAFVDPELGEDAVDYIAEAMGTCGDETVNRLRHVDVLTAGGINLRRAADRRWLAGQLEGCGRALLDSILDMVSEFNPNADEEVRSLFRWLEEIKQLSGVREILITVHMNRNKDERSFGAAAWEGKFQSLWGLFKLDQADGTVKRYFKVEEGRKTGPFPESEVVLDAEGLPVLGEVGVGRRESKEAKYDSAKTLDAIVAALALWPGKCSDSDVERICKDAAQTGQAVHVGRRQVVAVGAQGIEAGVLINKAYTVIGGKAVKVKNVQSDWKLASASDKKPE